MSLIPPEHATIPEEDPNVEPSTSADPDAFKDQVKLAALEMASKMLLGSRYALAASGPIYQERERLQGELDALHAANADDPHVMELERLLYIQNRELSEIRDALKLTTELANSFAETFGFLHYGDTFKTDQTQTATVNRNFPDPVGAAVDKLAAGT